MIRSSLLETFWRKRISIPNSSLNPQTVKHLGFDYRQVRERFHMEPCLGLWPAAGNSSASRICPPGIAQSVILSGFGDRSSQDRWLSSSPHARASRFLTLEVGDPRGSLLSLWLRAFPDFWLPASPTIETSANLVPHPTGMESGI